MSKSAGHLYQLRSTRQLSKGSYVAVNGPWDRFGVVNSSTLQEEGDYLNVIRGIPQRNGEHPVASF